MEKFGIGKNVLRNAQQQATSSNSTNAGPELELETKIPNIITLGKEQKELEVALTKLTDREIKLDLLRREVA